ncbi:acetyl-CoA C-acyltransferase [Geoalkalibacter halelectricus]|uniref:Acetyl-CoA C-acyltransferase n=1 Tax=Geoalkalibacter halelectricus TaxID=2847045 RepID=A0ABY5ZJC3_9BACT|nr:acetyl-CoA C-acyltransferase [Geoalkalibacter halelectricus]MDO3379490.1 acetyl-CoA C-acyltransferase [Geoalkalibacter halelectricus]UWZ78082.1 acetyl-CoA C-acyltransferase [Geoalkalibacter halelectricus]
MSDHSPRTAIVGGMRTPFVKAGGPFRHLDPLRLSSHAVRGLLERFALDPAQVERLVWGRVIHDPRISNLAREIVFDLKLPAAIHAELVSNNCITGIHAVAAISTAIAGGQCDIGIAGGVESMSNPPVLFSREAGRLFVDAAMSKTLADRLKILAQLRPRHFKPRALGFKEPSTGLTMGEHAEISAKQWQITRREQDEVALRSHQRAAAATQDGRLKAEIFPLEGVDQDTLVRGDTSLEKLARLAPVFDRSAAGTISAGNSSPLTDGASALLLVSEERAAQLGLKVLAYIKAVEFAAIDPADGLLMAPAVAVPRLLRRVGLSLEQMDLIEIHEAFGAQVACNLKAWEQGWKETAIGRAAVEKLNVLGSSIAVGHPFGATGTRILTTLANEMARREAKYGLASICAAGAMAAAVILERP